MHYVFMKLKIIILTLLCSLGFIAHAGIAVQVPLHSYIMEPTFVELEQSPPSSSLSKSKETEPIAVTPKTLMLHVQGITWSSSTNMLRVYLVPQVDMSTKTPEIYYLLNIKRSQQALDNPSFKDSSLIDISYMANQIKMHSDNQKLISGQRIIIGFKRVDLNGPPNSKDVQIDNVRVFWVEPLEK